MEQNAPGAPGGKLVEHDAERIQISAAIGRLAAQLLGGQIGNSPLNAGCCFGLRRRADRFRDGFVDAAAGYTEIEQLRAPVRLHHDVFRFDVAMKDAARMGCFESLGELRAEFDDAFRLQRSVGKEGPQRAALDQLHHQKDALAILADFVDGGNSGMMQVGSGSCFRQHARARFRRPTGHIGQDFDGYGAEQSLVMRAINDAHPAATQHTEYLVVRDGLSDK